MAWRINRKEAEGLFKFDGVEGTYRPWKSRIRDHASESWPMWRKQNWTTPSQRRKTSLERLQTLNVHGISMHAIASFRWSCLLRWMCVNAFVRLFIYVHCVHISCVSFPRRLLHDLPHAVWHACIILLVVSQKSARCLSNSLVRADSLESALLAFH